MADLTAKMILELVDRLSGPAKLAARRMSAMTKSANNMAKSFERITEGGRKARRVLRQLGADAKKLPTGRGIGRAAGAEDGIARRGRDPHRIWGRGTMAQAGRDISRFGRMSFGAMSSTLRVFADFDQKMGDVAAVTRGIEKEEFEAIRKKAREIGEATKFTATEAASAFEMLGMAGLDAATQLKVIDHVMNLSAAGAMNLSQTTDIATDVMMGFNLEADQMGRIANVLAIGATSATTTIAGLGKGLSKVAPAAAQLGVSLEETTAFLAAFANMGLKGGIGGRSLRRILISMVAPSKRAKAAMAELKVETTDAAGKMRRPVEIFQDLTAALRKLPEAERIAKLHKIFQAFGMVGAAGAVQQFSNALGKTPKEAEKVNDIVKVLSRMMKQDGDAAAMAGRRMDTMRGDSLKLKSALAGVAITIGEEFNEEIRELIREVTEAVRSFGNFAKENKTLVKILLKAWAVIAALAVVFGPLIVAVDTTIKLWMIMRSVMAASGFAKTAVGARLLGDNMKYLGGQTGIIGIAAAAAALAIDALITHATDGVEKLRRDSQKLVEGTQKAAKALAPEMGTAELEAREQVLAERYKKETRRAERLAEDQPWFGREVDIGAMEAIAAERREVQSELARRRHAQRERGAAGYGAGFAGPTQEMMALKIKVEADVPVKTRVEVEDTPANMRALIENLGLQGAGG
jgi:TP901 family phage tail tape measure protein